MKRIIQIIEAREGLLALTVDGKIYRKIQEYEYSEPFHGAFTTSPKGEPYWKLQTINKKK